MHAHRQSGFSLVEVAVVIAIIGLLAGGIIGGQAMINGSKVNKVLADAITYKSAMEQFRTQYQYFPGDFPTATQVWGRADGGTPITANCASPATDVANPAGTCNGSGDGIITGGEGPRAWQQMEHAGLIKGNFTGTGSSSMVGMVMTPPGVMIMLTTVTPTDQNSPVGPLESSIFFFNAVSQSGYNDTSSNNLGYMGSYVNSITFGKTGTGYGAGSPIIKAEDAYNIDMKGDDGVPSTGAIFGSPGAACSTATSYAVSNTTAGCTITFLAPFHGASRI